MVCIGPLIPCYIEEKLYYKPDLIQMQLIYFLSQYDVVLLQIYIVQYYKMLYKAKMFGNSHNQISFDLSSSYFVGLPLNLSITFCNNQQIQFWQSCLAS